MTETLPIYISIVFVLTTLFTLLFFSRAIGKATAGYTRKKQVPVFIGLTLWLMLQAYLSFRNIYNTDTYLFPPKILLLGVLPVLSVILLLFALPAGRKIIDNLPLLNLTYLNVIRIPVELVLYWLFLYKLVPGLMTFEGRNFDFIAGITAPFIAYFGFAKQRIKTTVILLWNFISLALLLNIVVNAILSAPTPLQKFAFHQPNIAILYFPFSWLPTFIVPVILFGHLTSIRQLFILRRNQKINLERK